MLSLTLGDRTFEVATLPIKRAKQWRKKLQGPFDEIASGLARAETTNITSVADVVGVMRQIVPILIEAPDTMFELLLEYAPNLAVEREWIEENATDEEAITAFTEVLRCAFPLAPLTRFLGQARPSTSMSSTAPNGQVAVTMAN